MLIMGDMPDDIYSMTGGQAGRVRFSIALVLSDAAVISPKGERHTSVFPDGIVAIPIESDIIPADSLLNFVNFSKRHYMSDELFQTPADDV